MLKSDFLKALDQVQEEKGISKQSLLNLMETALATAYRRAFNPPASIRVHVDPATAQIAIFGRRRVVENVQDSSTEISLDEARQLGAASLGDMVDVPLPTEDFARLAAQISKQVVFQRLRDAEKDQVLKDVLEHKGEMVSGIVELGSERVDIIPWADEPAQLVANALSPAQVLNVEIDRESRTATAHVPENQLSLAIGKDGQNARLAAKLTGWRIDIKPTVEGPHPDPPPHAGEGDSEGARPD